MKSDVWSMAVVFWEIWERGLRTPNDNFELVDINDLLEQLQYGGRLEKPENCPEELFSLMEQCWDANPENRPTFKQCVAKCGNKIISEECIFYFII